MTSPLLQTKLYRPLARPTWVARPHLFTKLQAGLTGKLTLVAAPAGFGKTTLICAWLHQVAQPAVWLALDGGDNAFYATSSPPCNWANRPWARAHLAFYKHPSPRRQRKC